MRLRATLSAALMIVAAVGLATPALAEPLHGVLEAVGASRVTVQGRSYAIEQDTELTDLGGQRLAPNELKPGIEVELDVDESGRLAALRAALVR